MPFFDTANNVLNDAAVELALTAADETDFYTATNPALIQLRRLLKGLGEELVRGYRWTHLQKTYLFITTPGVDAYALPEDFARLIDGTEWNRSQQMPLGGPLNTQGWQLLKAQSAAGTVWFNFRIAGNQFLLHPAPAAVESLAFEYVSRRWVQEAGDTVPTTEAPDEATDVLWFDRRLLIYGLRLRFLEAKGFPTAALQRLYEDALAAAQGGDGAAPVLSLDCTAGRPWDKPIEAWGPIGGGGSGGNTNVLTDGIDIILESEALL